MSEDKDDYRGWRIYQCIIESMTRNKSYIKGYPESAKYNIKRKHTKRYYATSLDRRWTTPECATVKEVEEWVDYFIKYPRG